MTVQKRSLILHILHRWSDEMIRSKTIISEGKWWRSIAWSIAARRNSGIRAQQLTQNNRSSYFNPISPVTPSSQLTTLLSSTPIYHFQRASKTCLSFVKLRFTWLNMPSWLIPRHFTLRPLIFFPFLYHFSRPNISFSFACTNHRFIRSPIDDKSISVSSTIVSYNYNARNIRT